MMVLVTVYKLRITHHHHTHIIIIITTIIITHHTHLCISLLTIMRNRSQALRVYDIKKYSDSISF